MFTFPTKEDAEGRAAYLNRHAPLRVRYILDPYPDGQRPREAWRWGVRREYKYADAEHLGWINGGFTAHCRF